MNMVFLAWIGRQVEWLIGPVRFTLLFLLGGVAGVKNPRVVVLGAGVAGQNAINVALGMGADVTVLGTHGKSGAQAFWDGSVAARVAAKSALPLLFVPISKIPGGSP